MFDSQTKHTLVQRHLENALLQAPILSPVRRSPRDLSVDHPTSPPASQMVESAVLALRQGQTHYVDVPGIGPLRDALAAYLQGMRVVGYEAANVLVTAGMQEARFLTLQIIGDLLGAVALPDTVHPGARQAAGVRRLEVRHLATDAENGFLPTPSAIRKALQEGCKLLYLESPVRLTGAAYDADSVAEVASLLEEFNAGVIWDQGMAPWVPGYVSIGGQAGMAQRAMLVGEAWPGMGLEAWFVGYVAAPEGWLEPIRAMKQVISICTSTPSQFAAVKAAELYPAFHSEQMEHLANSRQKALRAAVNVAGRVLPGSALNVLAMHMQNAGQARAALAKAGFGFADGADFGAPDVLRLSVTLDDTVVRALKSLL